MLLNHIGKFHCQIEYDITDKQNCLEILNLSFRAILITMIFFVLTEKKCQSIFCITAGECLHLLLMHTTHLPKIRLSFLLEFCKLHFMIRNFQSEYAALCFKIQFCYIISAALAYQSCSGK